MPEIVFPQQCENEGQMSQNSLGSTTCTPPDRAIIDML